MHITLLLVLSSTCCAVFAYDISYDGFELIEVSTETQRARDVITFMSHLDPQLDIWYSGPETVHVFVSPEKVDELKDFFNRNELQYKVINDRVQRDIEEEKVRLLTKRASTKAFDYDDFNTLDDIIDELNKTVERCPTDNGIHCELIESNGLTTDGHHIYVFRIWRYISNREGIWIDSTTHAREWLSTSTNMKILKHLIDDYETDEEVKHLVDTYDWYIVPVVNPDGYDYTWTTDRLWRKNRSPNSGSSCLGTDLNRNFDVDWGIYGSSNDPCSIIYCGSSAASEFETQALSEWAGTLRYMILVSVHMHTYGQMWLIPYGTYGADGTTCKLAPDNDEMMRVAEASADAVEQTFNTTWRRGNLCEIGGPGGQASGLTMDFFKDNNVAYPVLPELRGDNFIVPASEIQPSFEEIWNGIKTTISMTEQ